MLPVIKENAINGGVALAALITTQTTGILDSIHLDPCTVAYTLALLAFAGVKLDIAGRFFTSKAEPEKPPGT